MSRIQRLGIGNGGVDCQISYMQGKKYPNAGEIVKPVQGVSNRTLLKNPYNTINEPIAQPGQRPLRITTDNRGNVFARSETMLVPGVTNNNLLKNPYNILEEPVPEKRTLSLQRIKDINNGNLPKYVTENKGINEIMLQILTMIYDKPIKLITIQLLKILITKNASTLKEQTQQRILAALNAFDVVLTEGRKIFRENTLSPTKIPEMLQPAVTLYEQEIRKIYGASLPNYNGIDADIQTGLSEIALLSNALTRMFEYNNAIDPSNTLTREQIMSASLSVGVPPAGGVVLPAGGVVPPAGGVVSPADETDKQLKLYYARKFQEITDSINDLNDEDVREIFMNTSIPLLWIADPSQNITQSLMEFIQKFYGISVLKDKAEFSRQIGNLGADFSLTNPKYRYTDEIKQDFLNYISDPTVSDDINKNLTDVINYLKEKKADPAIFDSFIKYYAPFFFQKPQVARETAETKEETGATVEEREKLRKETEENPAKVKKATQALGVPTQAGPAIPGLGRHRAPQNKKIIIQTGAKKTYQRY
jgi:hypothetical protein